VLAQPFGKFRLFTKPRHSISSALFDTLGSDPHDIIIGHRVRIGGEGALTSAKCADQVLRDLGYYSQRP